MAELKITQVRSSIGARWKQRESLRTLGLRRIRHSVVREDSPQVRGLIAVVNHLVKVEPVPGDSDKPRARRAEGTAPTAKGGKK
jgi:large subunit ribosomal protein L30